MLKGKLPDDGIIRNLEENVGYEDDTDSDVVIAAAHVQRCITATGSEGEVQLVANCLNLVLPTVSEMRHEDRATMIYLIVLLDEITRHNSTISGIIAIDASTCPFKCLSEEYSNGERCLRLQNFHDEIDQGTLNRSHRFLHRGFLEVEA